jgi:phage terminase large subunit GpA-like protein
VSAPAFDLDDLIEDQLDARFVTPAEARAKLAVVHGDLIKLWEPPPQLTTSEWADRYRIMPLGTTSRPGPWRTEAYQREMMDVFDDPAVHKVVVVKPTQIGYTEVLNNVIGRVIHLDPKPMMLVLPSLDDAKGAGKKRITPMVNACPELRDRVKKSTSRASGNTLLLKEFAGGYLKLTGANSGKGLRSDPLSIVLFDEADAYPLDVDGEGDPLKIGENRTEGYDEYKVLIGSTPARSTGNSRVEAEFNASDQRRFHVPCPHCGLMQVLYWRDPETQEYRLVWERNPFGEVIRESVRYICVGCNVGIAEKYKSQMLEHGEWVAQFPGREVVGFHINALYRPWKENWGAMAREWVKAKGDNDALKEFITLQLAEFWNETGEQVKKTSLLSRREDYPRTGTPDEEHPHPWEFELVPKGTAVLTCQADVQHNRVEATVKAWGAGEESWLLAHEVFWGDPQTDESVWAQLDAFRIRDFTHECGPTMRPILTVVDSGDGTAVDAVYDYVMPRQNLHDRVFAVKGVPYHSKPVLVQEGTTKRNNIRLFTIATMVAKDRIFSRLLLAKTGAGYLHFPSWTTEEFFDQITSEHKVPVRNKKTGVKKLTYIKTHARNEALDLEVYALGALFILQRHLDPAQFGDLEMIARILTGEIAAPAPAARRIRSRGVA